MPLATRIGFSIDPDQGLSESDELYIIRLGAYLGYDSAWTPSGADARAFDRCLRWHAASGLAVGISAVPASGQSPDFYAQQTQRLLDSTEGKFTLVVGSGQFPHPAPQMRSYLADLRPRLADGTPLYAAALGPLMLRTGVELADGVALNWCSASQVAWSRRVLDDAARALNRPVPRVIEYIRTAVDPDVELARKTVFGAAVRYLQYPPYRRHFERMGVASDLQRVEESSEAPGPELVSAVGAAGTPDATRQSFERLAAGLDLPIVRVLVTRRGDAGSARRVLYECRPSR
jgi:alkanesulfonate monooxygenase SsuD/methylene tetrahydromethanopterin reductase-like flavin-dependent oxidoreductase (luciferase family)